MFFRSINTAPARQQMQIDTKHNERLNHGYGLSNGLLLTIEFNHEEQNTQLTTYIKTENLPNSYIISDPFKENEIFCYNPIIGALTFYCLFLDDNFNPKIQDKNIMDSILNKISIMCQKLFDEIDNKLKL